jgi:hypothetical protein
MATPIRDAYNALPDVHARAEFIKTLLRRWNADLTTGNDDDDKDRDIAPKDSDVRDERVPPPRDEPFRRSVLRALVAPGLALVERSSDDGVVRGISNIIRIGEYDRVARLANLSTGPFGGRRRKTRKGRKGKKRSTRKR